MATTTTTKAQKSSTHRSPQGYTNNDTTLNETQRKYKDTHRGLMCPTGPALSHPAAPMLKKFATEGYPTESTYEWNLAELDDAVEMGPHQSARETDAAKACRKEALEKVEQGFCSLIPWKTLRKRFQTSSKCTPLQQ